MTVDFSGYATKSGVLCSDGRVIGPTAFADQNGSKVPLIWSHQHDRPEAVLGHALLEQRDDGVYAKCTLNNTVAADNTRAMLANGDLDSLSIWANQLKHEGTEVIHGVIREVSLVLAGANPEARIDAVYLAHDGWDEEQEDQAIIQFGEKLSHGDGDEPEEVSPEETIADVLAGMSEKEQDVVAYLVSQALGEPDEDEDVDNSSDETKDSDDTAEHSDTEKGTTLAHNVFQGAATQSTEKTLSHDEMKSFLTTAAQSGGRLSDAVLRHGNGFGVNRLDYLFPDYKQIMQTPEFKARRMEWVSTLLNAVHHTPYSRVKSTWADITADAARAKGYITGKFKKDEVFEIAMRTTYPQTVYKKQKMDRDDILDVTTFDLIAWLKAEMRMMLDEEIARAILVGDGRQKTDDEKIKDECIRPIWTDSEIFCSNVQLAADATVEKTIEAIIRSHDVYNGSGNPTLFAESAFITDMLLEKDKMGRRLYETEAALAAALGVSKVVRVPVMKGLTRKVGPSGSEKDVTLQAIIVNPNDYNVGTDSGGQINFFDDFDIDYNQFKYLYETRMSGALVKIESAVVVEKLTA